MKHLDLDYSADQAARRLLDESAYRIPASKFPLVARFMSQEGATSIPVTEMVVNSLITSYRDGAKVTPGKVTVSGLAWDGGYGIRSVEISTDAGKTWSSANWATTSAAMGSGHGSLSSTRSAARTR